MNLRQMEVFRAVMLTGSVVGAAKLLYVSQPAVSKALALARRQAGFDLFERIKGRLVATPEGQILFEEVETLWRGVERVRDVSRNLAGAHAATLRVAVSASIANHLAPRAMARLYERFADLRSHMEILVPTIMESALLDRSIDIAVALQPTPHPNLAVVSRYRCGLACVMHESHPLARKKMIVPRDLDGERLITSTVDTPYGRILERAYGGRPADLEVRSSTMACWYAQARAGIAVVDRAAVAGEGFSALAVRPFKSTERLEVAIVRNLYKPMSLVERAFGEAFDSVWRESLRSAV